MSDEVQIVADSAVDGDSPFASAAQVVDAVPQGVIPALESKVEDGTGLESKSIEILNDSKVADSAAVDTPVDPVKAELEELRKKVEAFEADAKAAKVVKPADVVVPPAAVEDNAPATETVAERKARQLAELLDDPVTFLSKLGDQNAKAKAEAATAHAAAVKSASEVLTTMVPNAEAVAKDPDFAKWIQANETRKARYLASGRSLDVTTRAEMMSTFNEIQAAKGINPIPITAVSPADTGADAARVAMAAAGAEASPAPTASKRTYRSADLIALRNRDPESFAARSAEFKAAYAEGRVVTD